MKILYVYEKMPTTYQQYLLNLLQIVRSSLNVKTLTYSADENADYIINTYSFKDNFQRFLFKIKLSKYKTLDALVFNKFDIIHLQHSFLFNKIKPLICQTNRPKIIITLRGGDTYIKPWVDKRWKELYKNQDNLINAYITVSKNQKEYLLKWGVSEKKVHVIPVTFGEKSETKPKKPNSKKMMLASAFRMTWEKNIEGSIQFAKRLKDKGVDFQYDIYGYGDDLGQLYFLIDKFNLQEYVFVKGKIKNDELKVKLINYDFFIQLSISEALSVSVIEAQSLGLPCIVSNAGGLPEVVVRNKSGIVEDYFEIDKMVDQCIEIYNNEEIYMSYSKYAINYYNENFTISQEKEKLIKLYEQIIKE